MKRKISIILVLALTLLASSLCIHADNQYEYNGKNFHVSAFYYNAGTNSGNLEIEDIFPVSGSDKFDGKRAYVTYDGQKYYSDATSEIYITLPAFENGKKITVDGIPLPNGYQFAWNNTYSEVLGSEKYGVFNYPEDCYYLTLPIVHTGEKVPFKEGSDPGMIKIKKESNGYTYTGKEICPKPIVIEDIWYATKGLILKEGVDYTLSYKNNVDVGKGTIIIKGLGIFDGIIEESFSILMPVGSKDPTGPGSSSGSSSSDSSSSGSSSTGSSVKKKENTLTVKAKNPSVKTSKVKKKKQVIKASKVFTIKNAQGAVSFKKKSGDKKLSINSKTGAITVKKGAKKGIHKIKVAVTAAGNENYEPVTITVTVKIRVK